MDTVEPSSDSDESCSGRCALLHAIDLAIYTPYVPGLIA